MTYPTIEEVLSRICTEHGKNYASIPNGDIIKAACDLDRARRGGEGPVLIPWKRLSWAHWAAKDPDGRVFVYAQMPTIYKNREWFNKEGRVRLTPDAHIPGPWTESLRKRPEGV